VRQEITANPQFTLLDEQQVTYEVVLRAVEHARRSDAKEAVIITGGPGTGKSVIAIALLAELPSGATTSPMPRAAGPSPPLCGR
jgi:DNA replication protein DnaC